MSVRIRRSCSTAMRASTCPNRQECVAASWIFGAPSSRGLGRTNVGRSDREAPVARATSHNGPSGCLQTIRIERADLVGREDDALSPVVLLDRSRPGRRRFRGRCPNERRRSDTFRRSCGCDCRSSRGECEPVSSAVALPRAGAPACQPGTARAWARRGARAAPGSGPDLRRTLRGLQPPPDGLTVGGRSSAPEGKVTSSFAASASISFVRASW